MFKTAPVAKEWEKYACREVPKRYQTNTNLLKHRCLVAYATDETNSLATTSRGQITSARQAGV